MLPTLLSRLFHERFARPRRARSSGRVRGAPAARLALGVALGAGTITLGLLGWQALRGVPSPQSAPGTAVIALAAADRGTQGARTPPPSVSQLWLSSMFTPEALPDFARPEFDGGRILPHQPRPLPALPPRAAPETPALPAPAAPEATTQASPRPAERAEPVERAEPAAPVERNAPVELAAPADARDAPAAPLAPAPDTQPTEIIAAPAGDSVPDSPSDGARVPEGDVTALAALRAPTRSPRPAARPAGIAPARIAPAPVETPDGAATEQTAQAPEDAAIVAASRPTDDAAAPDAAALRFALARSLTPRPRPARVAQQARVTLAAATAGGHGAAGDPAPQARQQARAALDVPPLNRAIARANPCGSALTRAIPRRPSGAEDGAAVIARLASVSGRARDDALLDEILRGNIPEHLRQLVPVTFTGTAANGQETQVTICVMPDYLAVGSDRDFVRVPLGLPAATRVAARFDMVLPTTRMVDEIYAQANLRLSPAPMQPGSQMASTGYFLRHNTTVEEQRRQAGGRLGMLVSGHKKDLVLTNRLERNPGRVAIYGWHRRNGRPIQPLSTVHGAQYADYSHGVRLVSRRAFVNGRAIDLGDLLADSRLAGLVSSEGPISNRRLLAALR